MASPTSIREWSIRSLTRKQGSNRLKSLSSDWTWKRVFLVQKTRKGGTLYLMRNLLDRFIALTSRIRRLESRSLPASVPSSPSPPSLGERHATKGGKGSKSCITLHSSSGEVGVIIYHPAMLMRRPIPSCRSIEAIQAQHRSSSTSSSPFHRIQRDLLYVILLESLNFSSMLAVA